MFPLDFETKSSTPITRGHDNYFQDPDADVLCLAYGHIDDEEPKIWYPDMPRPAKLIDHAAKNGLLAASNAAFDQAAWDYLCVELYDFPPVSPDQWYCTQVQSRLAGLPSSLDDAARALGVKHRKSRRGSELIKLMCIPPFQHTPELLDEMISYCLQDWRVMVSVMKAIPHIPQHLFEDYHVNQKINERGIKIDRELALAATALAEQERDEIAERIIDVTCGEVEKHTQTQRFRTWLMDALEEDGCDEALKMMVRYKDGEKKYSADKTVRANMLADPVALDLAPDVAEALQLMDDAGGSAVSKFKKMVKLACDDDRVRGAIRFAGAASTLRFSSLGLQVHNFRRDALSADEAEHYKNQLIQQQPLTSPEGEKVSVMDTLGKLLRSAILPDDGNVFVVGDWSAIESRMTAWLAGDKNKLRLFREGGDPYCYAAEGIYNRPINATDHPKERQVGKVTDLACGFLGGTGALRAMASSYRLYIEEEKQQNIVDGWRAKHPKVVKYGDKLMAMAMAAMRNSNEWMDAGNVAYIFDGDSLYARLPDGKTLLRYAQARVEMQETPWGDKKPCITALKAAFKPSQDATEWPRHTLWRGLLLENVVQACCAVMLRDKAYEFQDNCVFHVHDELILEVPEHSAEMWVKELQAAMEEPPVWCSDLPLTAEPEIMTRYGK